MILAQRYKEPSKKFWEYLARQKTLCIFAPPFLKKVVIKHIYYEKNIPTL